MNAQLRRIAIVDLGTNTFNLLIAEGFQHSINFIFRKSEGVAFGQGSMQTKRIAPEAVQRAIATLKNFQGIAQEFQCSDFLAFSTASLRNALNQFEVTEMIERNTGIKIQVISGEQEAHWIALAALHKLEHIEYCMVLDIGGGSVEMIEIQNNSIHKLDSFPIGVTKLLEITDWSDPLSEREIDTLHTYFENTCSDFLTTIKTDTIIATAGVFETLVALTSKHKKPFNQPVELELSNLIDLLQLWATSTNEHRAHWTNIIPVRRRTLQITAILIQWILTKTSCKKLIATPNSLAEGVVIEKFGV